MTKIEVILQNSPKSAKNGQNLPLSDQKTPKFWIFPWVPLLTHASRHWGEDFRKFSAKTKDKIWSYAPKTPKMSKNWLYGARRQTYKLTEDTDFEFSYE